MPREPIRLRVDFDFHFAAGDLAARSTEKKRRPAKLTPLTSLLENLLLFLLFGFAKTGEKFLLALLDLAYI